MGSACSSGQTGRDRDSISTKSEESRSYQVGQTGGTGQGDENGGLARKNRAVSEAARRSLTEGLQQQQSFSTAPGQEKPLSRPPLLAHQHSIQEVAGTSGSGSGSPVKSKLERLSSNKQTAALLYQGLQAWKERKISLYVSAADSIDCKVEKSLLANEVFPELRQNFAKVDFEIHLVDLHWSQKSNSPNLCLHQLTRQGERSHIIPIVFLNDSLGTPLLPRTLECSDYETVFTSESDRKMLEKWYMKDEMAQPPCYRLQSPSALIPNLKSSDVADRDLALKEWRLEVDKILDLMLAKFSEELRDTYLTTVLEQEVQSTVMMSKELASRCIWFSRTSNSPSTVKESQLTSGELELKRRLEALKSTLKSELEEMNIIRVVPAAGSDHSEQPEYLSSVVAQLKRRLACLIEAILEEHEANPNFNGLNLEREIQWHKNFLDKNSRCGANRQILLDMVENYTSDGIQVFTGPEGCGKSALLSRLATQMKTKVIFKEVGLTRYSSTLVNLLYSLIAEIEKDTGPDDFMTRQHNIETYSRILPETLEKYTSKSPYLPLTIIIDGIDQFREFGLNTVSWLPKILPQNVKMIVSLSDSSDLLISKLKAHLDKTNAQFIPIPELTKEEAGLILMSSMLEYNYSVSPAVQESILVCLSHCTLPLYVKVLAWETSWCSEYSIDLDPQPILRDQLLTMLSELETMLGKEQVEKALSLLCSTKWGLTDSEILDILCNDATFHSSETQLPWTGACIFWAKLTMHLGPFLDLGEKCGNSLFPISLVKAVKERYRGRIPASRATLHRYFTGRLWDEGKKIKSRMTLQPTKYGETYNRRKLEELPYLTLKNQGSAVKYSLDPDWILDKLCGSSPHQLLEDLYLENENEDVQWLQRFLEINAAALDYDGRQLYAQIARHRYPLNTPLGQTLQGPPRIVSLIESEREEECEDSLQIDLVVRLPQNQAFVVTVSTSAEEISVWNIQRCKRVRQLKDVPQPTNLVMVDDFKAVVLCKRELRLYDLNKGLQLTLLKGVMNQKMPYFGLHDSEHLVALSRNRMYVNLMNFNTGDLVTTFKAGEDRFLNSLLVSGDGKVLVCGDETQKPMPLLVWNLSSRKLLYDLRIPQHDFITPLAAITHNGGYVAVVAKEVEDSSPNYIVVYDLQSGTLFKKWKRGVDTVAVEISSVESTVLSAHTDLTVISWDLVTGTCKWKVRGHRSPADILKLSPSGTVLLSRSSGFDTAIRLWDLSTGCLLAVFSPGAPIRNANLTDNHLVLSCGPPGSSFSTLQLQGPGYTYRAKEEIYGDEIEDTER